MLSGNMLVLGDPFVFFSLEPEADTIITQLPVAHDTLLGKCFKLE
jgi:hypothetical protein